MVVFEGLYTFLVLKMYNRLAVSHSGNFLICSHVNACPINTGYLTSA